jgi:hypothetical protein
MDTDREMGGGMEEGTVIWKETTSVVLSFGESHQFEISGILSSLYLRSFSWQTLHNTTKPQTYNISTATQNRTFFV